MLCFGDILGNSAVFLSLSELPFVTDVFCFFYCQVIMFTFFCSNSYASSLFLYQWKYCCHKNKSSGKNNVFCVASGVCDWAL